MALDLAANGIALSVAAPCYNEQDCLPAFYRRTAAVCTSLAPGDYEIILVDNGSRDATWQVNEALSEADARVIGVHLMRNHGHQLAATAGLHVTQGQRVMLINLRPGSKGPRLPASIGSFRGSPRYLPGGYRRLPPDAAARSQHFAGDARARAALRIFRHVETCVHSFEDAREPTNALLPLLAGPGSPRARRRLEHPDRRGHFLGSHRADRSSAAGRERAQLFARGGAFVRVSSNSGTVKPPWGWRSDGARWRSPGSCLPRLHR